MGHGELEIGNCPSSRAIDGGESVSLSPKIHCKSAIAHCIWRNDRS